MAMKIWCSLLLVVTVVTVQLSQSSTFSRSSLYVDPQHPGVYLTLEKKGLRRPHFPTESKAGVWLRFHNNMRVPVILLNADAAAEKLAPTVYENGVHYLNDGAEVEACYTVEAVLQRAPSEPPPNARPGDLWDVGGGQLFHAPVPEESERDSCYSKAAFRGDIGNSFVVLDSGTTALFSVPENFVSSGLEISTQFSYAWESLQSGPSDSGQVVHHVRYAGQISTSSKLIDPNSGLIR